MKYNPAIHHRRSIRLKNYDYAQEGLYFVTICVQNRQCLFGTIVDGEMMLNEAGEMVEKWYLELPHKFHDIKPDVYAIMPNHFHAIIENVGFDENDASISVGADLCVCPKQHEGVCPKQHKGAHVGADLCVCPDKKDAHMERGAHTGAPLHHVMQWFKTMTTNEYIRCVKASNWLPFDKRLWQRNYYEHIIRDANDYARIYDYIINNPQNWNKDAFFEN